MSPFQKVTDLKKDVPIPLYFQLKRRIEQKIEKGELTAGDLLPSERVLAKKYDVSRPTIRQALNELVKEGLLFKQKGKGTFVSKPKIDYGFIQKLTTFYEDMENKGYQLKTSIRKKELRKPTRRVAKKLDIECGNKIIFLDRLRYINNEPIVRVFNFLSYKNCPELLNIDLKNKSLYKIMDKKFGIKYFRAEISLFPTVAEKYDADLLGVKKGAPIHLMENITYDQNDEPMDYFESRFRGDKGKVMVTLFNK